MPTKARVRWPYQEVTDFTGILLRFDTSLHVTIIFYILPVRFSRSTLLTAAPKLTLEPAAGVKGSTLISGFIVIRWELELLCG